MSKKIEFNGKTYDCISVHNTRRFTRGSERAVLIIEFDGGGYDADDLYREFNGGNGDIVAYEEMEVAVRNETVTDDGSGENREVQVETKNETVRANECVYKGYTLFDGVSIKDNDFEVSLAPQISNIKCIITVVMAQKTYTEEQADAQRAEINALNEVMADVIGGVY